MALSRTYHHYDTFREELAKAYPAFGHALWEPDPGEYPSVEIGDVGFIRQGKFHRLFNALYSENHPSNQRFGVPEDHNQLQPVPNHIDRGNLNPNTFYSYGVSVVSGGMEALATGSIGSAEVSFSCTKKQGAVLTLPVTARREDTLTQDRFREWIISHIDSWFAFTQSLGLGIGMGDIILVTGCHRTRSWSNITFNEVQTDAQFSLGVEVAGAFGASVNWRTSRLRVQGAVPNHGPSGEDLPENQCIFIRGFRIKRTFLGKAPRIRAAAEPKSDPRMPGSDREPEKEVVSIPGVTEYQDPLHVLLEYIAKHAPDCEMALVHDDDLERILGAGDGASLEIFKPDMVMNYLERSKPEIESRSLPISRTDTGHVTVAMLSMQLKSLDIANTVQRAPLCNMAPVHDDKRKGILGIGDRTVSEDRALPSSSHWLATDPITNFFGSGSNNCAGRSDDFFGMSDNHLMVSNCESQKIEIGVEFSPYFVGTSAKSARADFAAVVEPSGSAASTSGNVRPICELCDKRFSKPQALMRHRIDKHTPRRICPLCPYQWTRPDKIKAHLLKVHREVHSAETLKEIHNRRGKDLVRFLDTIGHLPCTSNVIPQACVPSTSLITAPTEETTKLPILPLILPHPLPDYDIAEASPTVFVTTSCYSR